MPVHGIDDGNNKKDVYTTEEVLSILQQAIDSGTLQGIDPDETPIVAAVRESHNNSDVTFWSGTEAEFNELTGVTSELVGARIGSDGKLYLLTGDTTLSDTVEAARQAALEATEGMKREVISVTLTAAGWSNTAPYTQTVAVAGMTADKDFLAPYVVPTGNESDDLAAQAALSCISGGSTDTDSVTFYCYDEKPTTTITVYMVDKGTKIEPGDYPVATTSSLGMVIVGDNLTIENGRLSATGGGGSITVDSALSTTSTNPVQNKVVTNALSLKADTSAVASAYLTKTDAASTYVTNEAADSTFATQEEVQALASGSPLPASSTSEMTDTSRVYVNTTDGKWYYYDGSDWVEGGVYQASVSSGSLDLLNNDDFIQKNLGINEHLINLDMQQGVIQGNGTIVESTTRLVSKEFYRFSQEDEIFTIGGYLFGLGLYKTDGTWVGYYNTGTATTPSYIERIKVADVIAKYPTADIMKVMLRNSGNTTIATSASVNLYIDIAKRKALTMFNVAKLGGNVSYSGIWENIIFSANGNISSNSARLATRYFLPLEYINTIEVADNSGMEFGIGVYNASYTWVGYLKNASGDTQSGPVYFTSLDVTALDKSYHYRVYARYTAQGDIATTEGSNILFVPKDCNVDVDESGVVIENGINAANHIWTDYDARLAFGMLTDTAPVPTINKQQFINVGTLVLMKGGNGTDRRFNRWGLHVLEAYDKTNYNRVTMLTDKHTEDGRKNAELYYYTGADHSNASYGNFKLGSDVKNHSFNFSRDEMTAMGIINAKSIVNLARINPDTDLDSTYDNYADADAAYEADQSATTAQNAKCSLYIQLANAENGAMWYDSVRHKVVVKINGAWHDMDTTPVPSGTYDF